MAQFSDEQLVGLNAASERQVGGTANETDIKNLDYAKGKGYVYTPPTPVPVTQPVVDQAVTTEPVVAEPEVVNKTALQKNIQKSFDDYGARAGSNEQFVQGVAKFATGAPATAEAVASLTGKPLKDVISHYNIGDKITGFALESPEEIKKAEEDAGLITKKPTNAITSAIDDLLNSKIAGLGEGVDVNKFLIEKQDATTAVEEARQGIADKQLIDAVEIEALGDKPIPMVFIQRQQQKYSQDQYIDNLKMAQDYNNKLILSKMAEGNFLEAQNINKSIANDTYQIELLKIDRAKEQQRITENEATILRQEEQTAFERREAGFIEVSKDAYDKLKDGQKLTAGGKFYKTPEPEMSELELYTAKKKIDLLYQEPENKKWQIKTIDGVDMLFDESTGLTKPITPDGTFQDGDIGGQCGDYLHKIADNIPAMGDLLEEKLKMINIGPSAEGYQVGDVIVQRTNMPYGHVSIVTAVNGDQLTVNESNYGLDEKVGTRTMSMNDKNIEGAYRGAMMKVKEPSQEDIKTKDTLTWLRNNTTKALELVHAAGRSMIKEGAARFVFGATDKTRLEALTNTLRTNVLTLMTDPEIKKFFGPQMSEADVRLMTAGGTTLNVDAQNPDDMETELLRLDDLFNRMETALKLGKEGRSNLITAPDGQLIEIID